MKFRAPAASALKTITFKKGQIWRIGDAKLAIISVGKTMVHHQKYATHASGVHTVQISKADLRKYLLSGNGTLVAQVSAKRAQPKRQKSTRARQ